MRRALSLCILYMYCIYAVYILYIIYVWNHGVLRQKKNVVASLSDVSCPFRQTLTLSDLQTHDRWREPRKNFKNEGMRTRQALIFAEQLDTVCWIGSNDIKSDIHFQERLAFPSCRSFISRWDKPDKIKALTLGTPNKCKATMKKRTILKHVGWCRSIDIRS